MEKETADFSISQTKYLQIHQTRKQLMINNFIGGLAWALGATIGLALIIAILGLIAHYVNVIPFVGTFISNIIDFVLKNNSHLTR